MRNAICLIGIGLTLAACAAAPEPYAYYGSPGYYDYTPVYGTFDFDYGGGWDHRWHDGWRHDGHFANGAGLGHGFSHGGAGGHRG